MEVDLPSSLPGDLSAATFHFHVHRPTESVHRPSEVEIL